MSIAAPLPPVAASWLAAAAMPGPAFLVTVRLAARGRGAASRAVPGTGTAVWGAAGFFGFHAPFAAGVLTAALPGGPPVGLGLLMVAVTAVPSLGWYAPAAAAHRQGRRWLDGMAGTVFALFGARLAAGR